MILVLGLDLTSRAFWWLDLAIVIYSAVYLYSFFVQRRIIERIIEMTASPSPGGPPPGLPALAARAQRGGNAMLILLVIIVSLMVIKPQF